MLLGFKISPHKLKSMQWDQYTGICRVLVSHIIILSAEAGQLVRRKESPMLPTASDSTACSPSVSNFVMDPSDAELIQRHVQEQRGHIGKRLQFFLEGVVDIKLKMY